MALAVTGYRGLVRVSKKVSVPCWMAFLSAWLGPFAGSAEAPGRKSEDLGQKAEAPGQRMIEEYLGQKAVRLDARFLEGIRTKEDWEKVRPGYRREYLEMLGLWPLPERTPLEATVTGSVEREEGFRVEKLHFQSRPRLYVTGNLYLPEVVREGEKLPAVLYVCGHSGRGRDGNKTSLVKGAFLVDPPATHREGPIFLNVLRVLDVPDALGFLAPRPLRILTDRKESFARSAGMYAAAGGKLEIDDLSPGGSG